MTAAVQPQFLPPWPLVVLVLPLAFWKPNHHLVSPPLVVPLLLQDLPLRVCVSPTPMMLTALTCHCDLRLQCPRARSLPAASTSRVPFPSQPCSSVVRATPGELDVEGVDGDVSSDADVDCSDVDQRLADVSWSIQQQYAASTVPFPAAPFLTRMRVVGSAKAIVDGIRWKKNNGSPLGPGETSRNKSECLTLALLLDCIVSALGSNASKLDGCLLFQIAVRRFNGVLHAERTGSWELCDMISITPTQDHFLPEETLRAVRAHKVLEQALLLDGRALGANASSSAGSSGSASASRANSARRGRTRRTTNTTASSSSSNHSSDRGNRSKSNASTITKSHRKGKSKSNSTSKSQTTPSATSGEESN